VGSFNSLTTIRPVPPTKRSGSLGSGSARFRVPRETPGQKKENRIMYQNRATLIGFLGKDAEVKSTRNNASFTVLSLATKRSWKGRESGDRNTGPNAVTDAAPLHADAR
jgi:hypothetical protein